MCHLLKVLPSMLSIKYNNTNLHIYDHHLATRHGFNFLVRIKRRHHDLNCPSLNQIHAFLVRCRIGCHT